MIWETVKIANGNKGRTMPYASVGFGRISLNAAACELLGDYNQYKYAEFLKARENGKLCIGIKFLKEATTNSILIKRRKTNDGKLVSGMDISNKRVIEDLFGITGTANKATHFDIKKYEDNILGVLAE